MNPREGEREGERYQEKEGCLCLCEADILNDIMLGIGILYSSGWSLF